MNAETLGFTYGLSIANLDALDLMYLGRRQEKPKGVDFVETLISNYWDRKWYVGACALELNFRRAMPLIAIRRLVFALDEVMKQSLPFDWDELRFLIQVLDRLRTENRLPLLGLWRIVETLHRIRSRMNDRRLMSGGTSGADLVIDWAAEILLNTLDQITIPIGQFDTGFLWLELKTSHRPDIPLADLIPRNVYQVFGSEEIALVSGTEGSWTETWQVTIGALITIQLSLVAVNGVLTQVTKMTHTLRRLIKSFRTNRLAPKLISRQSKRDDSRRHLRKTHGSVPDLLSADFEVSRVRLQTLPFQTLMRFESAMKALDRLHEPELEPFRSYDTERLQSVLIRKPKNRTKGAHQAHPPAA